MEDHTISISHLNELLGLPTDGEENDNNSKLDSYPPHAFFGIYDGHSGQSAAEYSRIHLHYNIVHDPLFNRGDICGAIQNGYIKTDRDFQVVAVRDGINAGTTAVTVIVREDELYIANVGDSEAVLCRNGMATLLSYSHVPAKEDEKARIQKAGGKYTNSLSGLI